MADRVEIILRISPEALAVGIELLAGEVEALDDRIAALTRFGDDVPAAASIYAPRIEVLRTDRDRLRTVLAPLADALARLRERDSMAAAGEIVTDRGGK